MHEIVMNENARNLCVFRRAKFDRDFLIQDEGGGGGRGRGNEETEKKLNTCIDVKYVFCPFAY